MCHETNRYNGREYLKVIEESDMQWQHRKETNRRARVYGVSWLM